MSTIAYQVMGRKVRRIVFYFFLTLFIILWILPFVFIIFTAFKSSTDFYSGSYFSLPKSLHWKNFIDAWGTAKMGVYFKNSVLVTVIKVPIGIILSTLAAFGLTRMNFKYSKSFFVAILFGMMLPIHVALVPLTILLDKTNLLDTYAGLIIPYLGFSLPFGIFVARGYFRTLPVDIDDSARIDGCSDFLRYWKIIMPLAKPVIATLIIIDFLSTWNEFLMALLFMRTDARRTLPLGLVNFRDRYGAQFWTLMAGVLICIAPTMVVYIAFQKYFISGMVAGAVKG